MAACFQLARSRRPPSLSSHSPLSPLSPTSPTSSFPFSSTWTLEIPEAARTTLENITDPLVIISYFGCSQSVQDALWTALEQTYKAENTDNLDGSSVSSLNGGIWAWLSMPSSSPDALLGDAIQTLHLVFRDQEQSKEKEDEEKRDVHDDPDFKHPDMILGPLMALCSTQLNVISATVQDTEEDLARFTQSLQAFITLRQSRRILNLAPLTWLWCEPNHDKVYLPTTNADSGMEVLREVIMDLGTDTPNAGAAPKSPSAHLTTLNQCFSDIECYSLTGSTTVGDGRQDVDQILGQNQSNPTLADGSGNAASTHSGAASIAQVACLHNLVSPSNQKSSGDDLVIDSSRVTSGAELYTKMQACLLQLNTYPYSFNILKMRQTIHDLVRERAFHYGIHAYHSVMNEHLDRQPIPLSWQTLYMIHHDAQARALEEIEKRYVLASGYQLPAIMNDFRVHCLETKANAVATDDTASISNLEMMVPIGGLFLEYYTANITALQSHHLVSLDEHWRAFVKNRLPQATAHQATGSNTPSLLRSELPALKDHAEFLLAVDQVRRSYLGTCIPSPEAISVLEGLDEMQQTESVSFLKSIAATSPLTATSAQSKRSGSISHQPSSFSSGVGGNSDAGANENTGGSEMLTDTLNNKRTSIQAIVRANSKTGSKSSSSNVNGNADGGGGASGNNNDADAGDGEHTSQQQAEQTPKELEQQIAEILQTRRRSRPTSQHGSISGKGQGHGAISGTRTSVSLTKVPGSASELLKGDRAIVQFGWTLHMLHANTLQYAWIWTWFYAHEGSSRQNVVACDSKMYTASKWILLPAKDLIRTRKDWRVSYGDRVWVVSYWFATRNAKIELPEYLPRAQGAPCRHVVPYGETYVICKTCPADVLCMRCFRASDHADHMMYLQCSWGTSVCACGDPMKLKENNGLHCSLHNAESHRSYSRLAKGKPCQIKFKAGERVYHCKTCATDLNQTAVLCDRCFRSYNHFGHDVVAQIADEGMTCSCHDNKSWNSELCCTYHSPGITESEYLPKPLAILPPIPPAQTIRNNIDATETLSTLNPQEDMAGASAAPRITSDKPHRCTHIFQSGEDIYHCRDCSVNKKVVLCNRCFHGSACVNHQWRMGVFRNPEAELEPGSQSSAQGSTSASASASVSVFESLTVADDGSSATNKVSCDCGDPTMFKTAFDCNYHLPQEFRPLPNLSHCNYLFKKGERMFRCRTCHFVDEGYQQVDEEGAENQDEESNDMDIGIECDIWICRRCFDPAEHRGHNIEATVNTRNEGLHCHCGDPTVLRKSLRASGGTARSSASSAATADSHLGCEDDHNRQTVLCTTEVKEGMVYYSCQTCQLDPSRIFCEPCFILDAHEGHAYQKLPASEGFATLRCGCGENSAFRFATHCEQHERDGGTNVVLRCHYRASAGEMIGYCSECYPPQEGMAPAYLCQRCYQSSDHIDHDAQWFQAESDMLYPCACGSRSLSSLRFSNPVPTVLTTLSSVGPLEATVNSPSFCEYHTMAYKTTPSTTLFLHSHNHRSLNHQDHNEVTGYLYHDSDNDWIISRPDGSTEYAKYLQWKDVFWLQHVNTGRNFNSMASLKISQGFQEVSALEGPHSNNDWIAEETTWLRQQILSDE